MDFQDIEVLGMIIISLNLINVTTVQGFNEMVVTSTGSILPDLRDFFFYLNHSRHVIFSEHGLEFRILENLNFRTYQLIFTAIQRFLKKLKGDRKFSHGFIKI